MINSDSRYITAVIQTISTPWGPRREMRIPFPEGKEIQYTYYRITSADRPDTLGYKFFGNSEMWWVIANANPEYLHWLDIPIGAVIRVPHAYY